MDTGDRTDIIYHARPAVVYQHQDGNIDDLFNGGRHYPVYPVEDDAWQWINAHEHRANVRAHKPADIQPCPCSDHIFKLAKKQFRVVPIADAWEYIAQLGEDDFMTAFRASDCDAIRAGEHAFGCSVDRNHVMRPYRSRDYTQLTRDSPVFVLAAYSPYAGGRTLQCTHEHEHPVCNIYRLIREYVHMPRVCEAFANAIAGDMLAPGVTHIAGAVDVMARFIQQPCIVARFIDLMTPIKPIHICDIVRICAREVQDELIRARMDCNCVWYMVPKDVIKIIHRMVFDDYMKVTRHTRDRVRNWHTLPDERVWLRDYGFFDNTFVDQNTTSEDDTVPLDLFG